MNAKVGDGATRVYPSDNYPYVVIAVQRNGRQIVIQALATAHIPVNSNFIAKHVYTAEELENAELRLSGSVVANWSDKYQVYRIEGVTPVVVGAARYYRNYMD